MDLSPSNSSSGQGGNKRRRREKIIFDQSRHSTRAWSKSKHFGLQFDELLEDLKDTNLVICKTCRAVLDKHGASGLRYHINSHTKTEPHFAETMLEQALDQLDAFSSPRKSPLEMLLEGQLNEDNSMASASIPLARSVISRLHPSNTALLICDMQEKFRNNITHFPQITTVAKRLLDSAKLLDMKVFATEQYPKGLGHTVNELELSQNNVKIFEKTRFSMCLPELLDELPSKTFKSIILCGIEAHVCVYHTALDFLEKGYNVHVVADASSSRAAVDRFFSFRQLEKAGAVLTTSECVILGLVQDSAHPKFRAVQKLIMESAPDTGLLSAAHL
uniref:Isochorismatase domain-containing protein 1 n=1 Tax=Ditylenchus dipsaci TaxID=166011 RepID=A0A915D2B1_9BILA